MADNQRPFKARITSRKFLGVVMATVIAQYNLMNGYITGTEWTVLIGAVWTGYLGIEGGLDWKGLLK